MSARAAVLISGRGSNLRALIAASTPSDFPARIALVISNVECASGLALAAESGIESKIIPHKPFATREEFDAAINDALTDAQIEIVCLAGFMRILSDWFVRKWEGRLINIHPSLLPAYRGVHVHERVIAAGEKKSGCSVHFVVPELDAGPVIAQAEVPVMPGDTPEILAARVLEQEHKLYPAALKMLAEGKVRLENGRTIFAT